MVPNGVMLVVGGGDHAPHVSLSHRTDTKLRESQSGRGEEIHSLPAVSVPER